MRATLEGDSPPSTNSTARHRRRGSSLAVPIGLVILHYTDVQTPGQALPTLDSVRSLAGWRRSHVSRSTRGGSGGKAFAPRLPFRYSADMANLKTSEDLRLAM